MVGTRIIRRYREALSEKTKVSTGNLVESRPQFWSRLEEKVFLRVSGQQLLKLYLNDGFTFLLVQDFIDWIVGGGYFLEGEKETVAELEEWCESVEFHQFLQQVLLDILVRGAGNCWVELGYSETGDDVLGLRILDPEKMDYIRNSRGEIEVDDFGDPIGYVLQSGLNKIEWRRDRIVTPERVVRLPPEQDGRDRIAHLILFPLPGSLFGVSPLVSCYKQALIRLNLEENVGECAYRSGGLLIQVGAEGVSPSSIPDRKVDEVVEAFRELSHKTLFGFKRGEIEVERIPSPELRDRTDLIYTFADLQSATLGRGLINVLQSTARRGYGREAEMKAVDWELRIQNRQRFFSEQITKKILRRVCRARGLSTDVRLVFRGRTPVVLRERARAIATLARRGLIRYDPAIARRLAEELNLPVEFIEEELKRWREEHRTPVESKEVEVSQ